MDVPAIYLLIIIMYFARGNNNRIFFLTIDNSICFVNPSAPPASKVVFKWFGLTNTVEGSSLYIFNYRINSLECFLILVLPLAVFFPRFFFPK